MVASWSSASRRSRPLKSVCLGTFYIGRHKGVGKVWQITACDAASSYGLAGLLPAHEAAAAAMFLRDVVSRSWQGPKPATWWKDADVIAVLVVFVALATFTLAQCTTNKHTEFSVSWSDARRLALSGSLAMMCPSCASAGSRCRLQFASPWTSPTR